MHSRSQTHPYMNNSLAIRQEIQRFESVHPSIYAIYDLIDLLPDGLGGVAQQIRDHVVCIEDSFVNSQEWTLSRSVPDIRLGILGSLSSGKSALVHRYLTGSYMQEESPEGGRFKKECMVDNQSYLLLIRDEGGPPELQFTAWVDAVIFVFSLENESSFNAIYNYYTKMSHYRNSGEIPLILVGTQDAISENNPRVIDDARARKLATDLKRCSYYETCATYGLNVERVFQDACQKIVQSKLCPLGSCITPTNSRPSTPNNHFCPVATCVPRHVPVTASNNGYPTTGHSSPSHNHTLIHKDSFSHNRPVHPLSASTQHLYRPPEKVDPVFRFNDEKWNSSSTLGSHGSTQALLIQTENNNLSRFTISQNVDNGPTTQKDKDLVTPSSTPTTSRKSRRRSNLFTPSKKGDDRLKNGGDIGSGRAIPIKQGYLYKRSNKPLNKEWKKKYVTLCDDGRLTYHPSLHDYMDDIHGKEISLQYVTVKVPGQKPRGSKSIITVAGTNGTSGINEGLGGLCLTGPKEKRLMEKVLLTAFETVKDPGRYIQASSDEGTLANCNNLINGDNLKAVETPNVKKRHRRIKSNSVKNSEYDDSDGFEFYIVSLDNKQWHFDAIGSDERDDWVSAIEQQILSSLQLNETSKTNKRSNAAETATIQIIRSRIPGNDFCADCESPNPSWASLNLGVLICIECSGIHRNLGSHMSKVRSLDLDEWPASHLSVMLVIGNSLANSIWENRIQNLSKPTSSSPHEEKERWIRAKYETKEFLPMFDNNVPLGQQLIDAVCSSNIKAIVTVLTRATTEDVNSTVATRDLRTPLHLACAMGNLAVAQLLIWYNANILALDQDGRTCLSYARTAAAKNTSTPDTSLGFTGALIELLQANGCPEISTPGGTLPRRRGSQQLPHFEKISSNVL